MATQRSGQWQWGLAALVLVGCGAGQAVPTAAPTATPVTQVAPPADAERLLEQARLQALAKHGAVVVVLQADWCQPCNELEFRVLETNEGKALLAKHVLVTLDFDEPLGAAVASKLHVLGLPTTVVLKPDGRQLAEYARIEGFDEAVAWRAALKQALVRVNPEPAGCANAEDRPLDVTRPAPLLLTDAECLVMQLATEQGATAAAHLHALVDDPATLAQAQKWDEPARARLVGVGQSVGRFDARVAQNQQRAAALFAALAAWPGTPKAELPGLVFWHARCLAKSGDGPGAERVLDAWIAREQGSAAARLLAADLMVHEHVAADRAKRLLDDLLTADPGDHWAHYLAGELATQTGDRAAARKHLAAANQLKPGVALYIRHYLRVSGDAVHEQ